MGTPSPLEAAIHRTVCWFSLSGLPLSTFEIWKWLYAPVERFTLAEVDDALHGSPWIAEHVVGEGGFWALTGSAIAVMIAHRQERFVDAVRKFAKLKKAAAYFSLFGSVEGVAAVNTLAFFATGADSDIDLFIIVRPGTIWSTRLLLVLPFALLGRRPGAQQRIDPFCFSFFATNKALSLDQLRLPEQDPYFAYWTRSLVPVFDRGEVFLQFGEANRWVDQELPHVSQKQTHVALTARAWPTLPPFSFLEAFSRRLQERRFPARLRALMNRDSRVVVNDTLLKFHENDRREEYRDRFRAMTSYDIA